MLERDVHLRWCGVALLLAFAFHANAEGTGTLDKISGWFRAGTNITVTATPSAYSQFDYWTGGTNGASIAANLISFDATSARSITAVFKDRLTTTNSVPYWWLAGQGIVSNFEFVVSEDPDNDGFSTAEEYWSGTDPNVSNSHLRIDSIQLSGIDYQLTWAHAQVDTNIRPVCIQMRSSLATGDWVNVGLKAPVDGVNSWVTNAPPGQFFRLCVTNMP